MEITAQMVSRLREQTGVGMMECKKALVECDGDIAKALDLLRVRGQAGAEKRAGRATREGVVAVATKSNRAALVELCCETDFVARNDEFRQVAQTLAEIAADQGIGDVETLMQASADGGTVRSLMEGLVSRLRENILVRRCDVVQAQPEGFVTVYAHRVTNKIASVLSVLGDETNASHQEAARNAAMHIAAAKPTYLTRDDVPADVLQHEREVLAEKTRLEGKPEAAVPKIVEGRIGKFYEQVCLVDQPFVRDTTKTVGKMLAEAGLTPVTFRLFVVGQE